MSTILITGACGAIGSALVPALARQGHQLLLLDLDPLALNRVDDLARAQNTKLEPIQLPFDLWRSGYPLYEKLAQLIEKECGSLDVLIHCASFFNNLTPISQASPETWLQSLQVNLTAVQWLNQSLLPLLQKSAQERALGKILITTHPHLTQEQSVYWHGFGAAQSALNHLVLEWQAEQKTTGVDVFNIAVPWLDTPQSRNVFPAAKASWQSVNQILPLYLEVLHDV